MNKLWSTIGAFIFVFAFFNSLNLNAASGAACGNYLSEDGLTKGECDTAYVDASDKASLQRGAQIYMNYCLGCHSLKYARYKSFRRSRNSSRDVQRKSYFWRSKNR